MHLMRWWHLFPQIFLCSYPFPVHLKSIFVAGASWKVVQGETKLTLLTYVRSEDDDPLGPTPLDTYLLYYLLRGIFPCFSLLGRIVIKKWDFKPNAKAHILAPTSLFSFFRFFIFPFFFFFFGHFQYRQLIFVFEVERKIKVDFVSHSYYLVFPP